MRLAYSFKNINSKLVGDSFSHANTLRKSLQTTSALSATSKQCFEQPAASFLVCSFIFIEYKSLKIARKRARRLFLLYALFSFKGILNMVKEAFFLWIDF